MLRKLEFQDAERMYEWMHDEEVLKGLQADVFRRKTLDDCIRFINSAQNDDENCHRAIVDEFDTYIGTISLKDINREYGDAEFAIVLHSDAQGKGFAKQAMKEILDIAFFELGLKEVYWNVLKNNTKALTLYRKMGYIEIEEVTERIRGHAPKGGQVKFFCARK